jgi:predicted nucleic acid-binding protein
VLNPRVLDTSIASLLLNKSPALIPYTPYFDNALLAISFQTVAEMRFGALKAQWAELSRQGLEQFMQRFAIVGYDDRLASSWAEIMHDAAKVGRRLEAGDAWIAATAKYLRAPLLTHDKDFAVEACPPITIYRHVPK